MIELGATLSVEKAAKIARELKGFSLEKMFEVATYVMSLTKDVAFGIIERVKTYPRMPMEKIHEIVSAIPKGARWVFYFSDVGKSQEWVSRIVTTYLSKNRNEGSPPNIQILGGGTSSAFTFANFNFSLCKTISASAFQ